MKQYIGLLRAGAGQLPAVALYGHTTAEHGWGAEPAAAVITRCITMPAGGNLSTLRKEFLELYPDAFAKAVKDAGAWGSIEWRAKGQPRPLLVVDNTSDPSAEHLLPFDNVLTVTTGRTAQRPNLARLELLSDLKMRMSRQQLKAVMDNRGEEERVRKALTEISERPPRNESDNMALLDLTETESVGLAVAEFVHMAYLSAGVGMSDTDRAFAKANLVRGV